MQNLLDTIQSRLTQSLSLTHGLFHKVINIGGGGANTLHSLDKSPKNTLYSYKSAKSAKQLFHATIATFAQIIALSSLQGLLVSHAFALAYSWQSSSRNGEIANLRFDSRICR